MLEALTGSLIYTVCKDGLRLLGKGIGLLMRRRRLTPEQIIEKRQRWKKEIEERLLDRKRQKLNSDIIVRDMARLNVYPEIEEKRRGVSAWFKAGLIGTYDRGIQLGLAWQTLVRDGDMWRVAGLKNEGTAPERLILTGFVLYKSIEAIIWEGDDYYGNS